MLATTELLTGLFNAAVFGLCGIALTIAGFKIFDWITPRIDVQKELAEKQNIAVAIVAGAMIIGVAIVISAVIGA